MGFRYTYVMSLWDQWTTIFWNWLRDWLHAPLLTRLGFEPRQMALGMWRGAWSVLWYLLLVAGASTVSRVYMNSAYTLPAASQTIILKWAPLADHIGKQADIPRETVLTLWFKENSLQAINPESCIGIMGFYDLVRSGKRPCFTPGSISEFEVSRQLALGAIEFKKRCPEINYYSQSPHTLKKCYLAYNAGSAAAARLDPNDSAYVMNGYNDNYQNMVYQDVELGTVTVKTLGAYPAHLAIQSLVISQIDQENKGVRWTLLDASARLADWAGFRLEKWLTQIELSGGVLDIPKNRLLLGGDCLAQPHANGTERLKPDLSPIKETPILTQDIHGCNYGMPGIDISSENRSTLLYAPMDGEITTYTDQWYNSAIRIENEEWIVWMLHPRSYLVESGEVKKGTAVGVMGAVGIATGPHVHYAIYSKIENNFVDPGGMLP